jgi:amidophosphoribosyltransferase
MCGFIGIVDQDRVAGQLSTGLQALQHRGQDSCGIFTHDGAHFPGHRGLGLVRDVFTLAEVERLPGTVGLGHVRYPTAGKGVLADTQPFFERRPGVIMAHNGNVTNYDELERSLMGRSIHLVSRCDVEPILCIFSDEVMKRRRVNHTAEDVAAALRDTVRMVRGAYSVVFVMEVEKVPTLVAFRDPHGIRPLVMGRSGDAWCVSSESVALDALGYELVGELQAGEVAFFRAGQEPLRRMLEQREPAPCVFEAIYFSRPDSVERGETVYERRLGLGRRLAREFASRGLSADRVIPVPDTSRPAAIAFAEELGLPCREGFIKNRYSGRTFIMGSQAGRENALRLKLNLIRKEFEGQRVVVIDDSIVRGSTIRRLLDLVWAMGPKEVHFAIHAPPVLNPCFYGIDMSTEAELAAPQYTGGAPKVGGLSAEDQRAMEERWAQDLGIDSLTFLSVAGLDEVFPGHRCAACFDGVYPMPVSDDDRLAIVRDRLACG